MTSHNYKVFFLYKAVRGNNQFKQRFCHVFQVIQLRLADLGYCKSSPPSKAWNILMQSYPSPLIFFKIVNYNVFKKYQVHEKRLFFNDLASVLILYPRLGIQHEQYGVDLHLCVILYVSFSSDPSSWVQRYFSDVLSITSV